MTDGTVVRTWKTGGRNVMSLDAACHNIHANGMIVNGKRVEVSCARAKAMLLGGKSVETTHATLCLERSGDGC